MSNFVNSFQIPNSLVDELMADMSANALRCYLLITRKTTGWGKVSDRISISQFMRYLGIKDKRTVFTALDELLRLNLITAMKNNGEITEYFLVTKSLEPVTKNVGTKFDTSDKNAGTISPQPVTKNVGAKFDTSDKNCLQPGTKNVTATRYKKCHSTKDTIKYNNTKEKILSFGNDSPVENTNKKTASKTEINIDFDLVMDAFNDAVENRLPHVKKLTPSRKTAVKKLFKELEQPTFHSLANYFYDFVERANAFYFGENPRNWKADFDYIIKPSTYLKVLEGAL